MNYTVRWLPAAEEELAGLWLDAANRAEITRAAHALDERLQLEPEQIGESRTGALRIHFEGPLGVLFRPRSDVRLVEVVHVWRFD